MGKKSFLIRPIRVIREIRGYIQPSFQMLHSARIFPGTLRRANFCGRSATRTRLPATESFFTHCNRRGTRIGRFFERPETPCVFEANG
jgi:hypothetical protein